MMRPTAAAFVIVAATTSAGWAQAQNESAASGAVLYQEKCAGCHDQPNERTPSRPRLAQRTAEEVIAALDRGTMKEQGAALSDRDRRAVALFITGGTAAGAASPVARNGHCNSDAPIDAAAPQWMGWGRDLENTRYQPSPGLNPENVPRLKLKWAFGYPGSLTYGQPAIVGNRLFVSSATGWVAALNARSGCVYWSADLGSIVRTAALIAPLSGPGSGRFAVFFGDGQAVMHALDATSGTELWQTRVETHPMARLSAAPAIHAGHLYVPVASREEAASVDSGYECCSFRGSVVALDAASGKISWQRYMIATPATPQGKSASGTQLHGPAGAAIWDTPTIDVKRNRLYVGTGNSYTAVDTDAADAIAALDLDSGAIVWSRQMTPHDNFVTACIGGGANCPAPRGPDFDFGSSPILRTLDNGKQVILAGQKSGVVYALDPEDGGKVLWETRVGQGGTLGGIEWGPAADERNVYVAVSDLFRAQPGGLTAIAIADGKPLWSTRPPPPVCSWGTRGCSSAQSAAVTAIPGVVFSGSIDGHLRAYSATDGRILWDVDTAQSYASVNGVPAKGGSLDSAGPTIAGGMLYVNSGYGRFVGEGGNALLAFSVDGQ
jgi:polyvinyl alcohol dehydrogenase (cytochrome)